MAEQTTGKNIYVLITTHDNKLPSGERVFVETTHPMAIDSIEVARECLRKARTSVAKHAKVSAIIEDGFTVIYPNGKALSWSIKEKPLITHQDQFEV